jgi:hypothetical protein
MLPEFRMEVCSGREYQKPLLLLQFSGLKKGFPEIPPPLPFSKGGELFGDSMEDFAFPSFGKGKRRKKKLAK